MNQKTLLLLDFDGTITAKDTFPLFIKFDKGLITFISVFVLFSPLIFLYKIKLYEGGKIKESILSLLYKKESLNSLLLKGELFIEYLFNNNWIRQDFLEMININKSLKNEICIVSASPNIWIKPIADKLEINSISTELDFDIYEKFTGKFKSKNCVALEKANRIKQVYDLKLFDNIVAYGNSNDDNEMFKLATAFYRI